MQADPRLSLQEWQWTFDISHLDLQAVWIAALDVAKAGKRQPPGDSPEVERYRWAFAIGRKLEFLERLLNPLKLSFSDQRRTYFHGPAEQSEPLSCLRGAMDRVLAVLCFQDIAHKEAPGNGKRIAWSELAASPKPPGRNIDPREWERIAEAAEALGDGKADGEPVPGEPQATPEQDGPWSKADSPKCWGKAFGFSSITFIRRVKAGTIRAKKLSDKSYQVHVDDVPLKQK